MSEPNTAYSSPICAVCSKPTDLRQLVGTCQRCREKLEPLTAALLDIQCRAKEHPCFDADCFDRRDIDLLCEQGGDICDWTMIAILANDALKEKL